MSRGDDYSVLGYAIPMPRSELLIALATVISFLPFTVLTYRTYMWIGSRMSSAKHS